jgi:hypothetical protein
MWRAKLALTKNAEIHKNDILRNVNIISFFSLVFVQSLQAEQLLRRIALHHANCVAKSKIIIVVVFLFMKNEKVSTLDTHAKVEYGNSWKIWFLGADVPMRLMSHLWTLSRVGAHADGTTKQCYYAVAHIIVGANG